MIRYIIRRLLQGIPLLFIISLVLFLLMDNIGDPLATMGGRTVTRAADRERLTRQLGLDQPVLMRYLYWLIGNDWTKVDLDGDGIPETPGTRRGVLRGDFGMSLVARGRPAIDVIAERIPNTLLLMIAAEVVIIAGALVPRHLLGAAPVFVHRSRRDDDLVFILLHAHLLHRPGDDLSLFGEFQSVGACLPCRRTACSIRRWARRRTGLPAHDPAGHQHLGHQLCRLQPLHSQHHAGSAKPGLHPHGQIQRAGAALHPVSTTR